MFTSSRLAVVLMLAIGFLAPSTPGWAHTQAEGAPADVAVAVLGSSPVTESPERTLVLLRISLSPGAVLPAHGQLGDAVLVVESGVLGYTAMLGDVQATWGSVLDGTEDRADVGPGSEVMLYAGDWLRKPKGTSQQLRGAGPAPVVLLISAVIAADQPFLGPYPSRDDQRPAA